MLKNGSCHIPYWHFLDLLACDQIMWSGSCLVVFPLPASNEPGTEFYSRVGWSVIGWIRTNFLPYDMTVHQPLHYSDAYKQSVIRESTYVRPTSINSLSIGFWLESVTLWVLLVFGSIQEANLLPKSRSSLIGKHRLMTGEM